MNAPSNVAGVRDAVIIGGGFYGAAIAIYLAKSRGFQNIVLLEREAALLTRASYNNQARVHNGYHYPRSFTTAYRSQVNLPKFVRDWPNAVKKDFLKLYAIARRNSKVTPKQFERFCREIDARVVPAAAKLRDLFDARLIEAVFEVDEYAFDSTQLAQWAVQELTQCGVHVVLQARAQGIVKMEAGGLQVEVLHDSGVEETIRSHRVFNCTYSGLNQFHGDYPGSTTTLKHEITEMALVDVPPVLRDIGITVMDGPFFSLMPFPARKLHTLSHVRYTPHMNWLDKPDVDPYQKLAQYERHTRVDRMKRDVVRYLPAIRNSLYVDSLFEVKTILVKNEGDDGRPILFEKYSNLAGFYSVLGGKIDNIYDVLEKLDAEVL